MQQTCKFCGFPVSENFYFCPNCGKKLKEPPLSISVGKQIGIYALSILLPPLGLGPGIKYILNNDSKAKMIGLVAIILTIISTVLTIWLTYKVITSQVGGFTQSQVKELQNLGY